MDRDEFFSNLFNEDNPRANAARENAQVAYEGRVVRRLFAECGVRTVSWGRLINDCRVVTGEHHLTFNWFNYTFSRFPARLFGKRIGYCSRRKMDDGTSQPIGLYQLQLADIFKPTHNVLARVVSKALHAAPDYVDGAPYVFVFPVVRRMFCAHNLELAANPELDTPRIQWIMQTADGAKMAIESTASLFAAIGNEWFESAQ